MAARPTRPLTPWEATVYREFVHAADAGGPAPSTGQLLEALEDCISQQALIRTVYRLATFGLIIVERFQRGRRITIRETGRSTAQPRCMAPHWRDRGRITGPPNERSAPRQERFDHGFPDQRQEGDS